MKFLVTITYLAILTNCKPPVDHSQSEDKTLSTVGKAGKGTVKDTVALIRTPFVDKVRKLARGTSGTRDDGVDEIRMMFIKGGKEAREVSLAFREAYSIEFLRWGKSMAETRSKIRFLQDNYDHFSSSLGDYNILYKEAMTEYQKKLDHLATIHERRTRQISKITDVDDPPLTMNSLTLGGDLALDNTFRVIHSKANISPETAIRSGKRGTSNFVITQDRISWPISLKADEQLVTGLKIRGEFTHELHKIEYRIYEALERNNVIHDKIAKHNLEN